MCFTSSSCPGKKKGQSKIGFKASNGGSRIILDSDGAKFSFSSTSKLPSNLFIRQDFYGADKFHLSYLPPSRSAGTLAAHIQSQCTPQPCTDDMIAQIWAAQFANLTATATPPTTSTPTGVSQPTGAELLSAVTAAQRLAHNLREACATPHSSHSSSCSSSCASDASDLKRILDRDRHDSLLLSLSRKNAEDLAALKLDRDIDQKIARTIRDKELQALLLDAAQSRGLDSDGPGVATRNALARAEMELERRESRLLMREMEQERKGLLAGDTGNRNSSGSGSRGAISRSDPQLQFNLFQDLSSGRVDGIGGGGDARNFYMDGLRERRRSSVDRGAGARTRRLVDAVARMEAEVEGLRRRTGRRSSSRETRDGRERDRRMRMRGGEDLLDGERWDRWDRWDRWEGEDDYDYDDF